MDAALNLPRKGVSDLLRQWRERLAVSDAYNTVGERLFSLLGLKVSTRALSQDIGVDGQQVKDYYAQAPAPVPEASASLLVVQADGKGVPMILETPAQSQVRLGKGEKRGRKKEAVVTAVYTQAPAPRTPESVARSFFHEKQDLQMSRSRPQNKRLWATLSGKEAALKFAVQEAERQEGPHIGARVALTDGSEALQNRVCQQLASFTLVLDFVHANEYLWKAANALLGETSPKRIAWVRERSLQMLSGQSSALIADLRQMAQEPGCKLAQKDVLEKVAAYFARNQGYMRYDHYLRAGWPIATGVIEGACRHLVKDRCERSGMRWSQPGAEALLHLRCVAENGDWDSFHAFRRAKRHQEVYGRTSVGQNSTLEVVACRASGQQRQCLAA